MSDASVGYPSGLTRERLISFARNIINRGFSQKHYSPEKKMKYYYSRFAVILFHKCAEIS
jgi:hypothetical protein